MVFLVNPRAKKSSTSRLHDKPVVFHPKLLFPVYVCVVYARPITKIWNLMVQNELKNNWVRNSRSCGLNPGFHIDRNDRCDCMEILCSTIAATAIAEKNKRETQQGHQFAYLMSKQRFMHTLHAPQAMHTPHVRFSFWDIPLPSSE